MNWCHRALPVVQGITTRSESSRGHSNARRSSFYSTDDFALPLLWNGFSAQDCSSLDAFRGHRRVVLESWCVPEVNWAVGNPNPRPN
jgi:hypothetical protein